MDVLALSMNADRLLEDYYASGYCGTADALMVVLVRASSVSAFINKW